MSVCIYGSVFIKYFHFTDKNTSTFVRYGNMAWQKSNKKYNDQTDKSTLD